MDLKKLGLVLLFAVSFAEADYRPSYSHDSDDVLSSVMSRVEHLVRNDELECLPRLFCEYTAGGKLGQGRAINVDISSLFTLLQYLGLDQNSKDTSPMVSFVKAATLGLSHRGDSYECYRQYPRCPRDEARLLHYLNNHRGGFFRGFSGYYNRNKSTFLNSIKPVNSESRIVNNKQGNNFGIQRDPPSLNNFELSGKPSFVFSNDHRESKGLKLYGATDRLPNRLYFPDAEEGSSLAFPTRYNDVSSTFFPQV